MLARCLPRLLAILMAATAYGEPAAPPSPAPDFSAGFSRLAALGLPPLDARAKWTSFPETSDGDDYYFWELLKPLKGNGWSLPSDDGKPLSLPAGAVATLHQNPGSSRKPSRGLLGMLFGGGGSAKPTADLAKDISALTTSLRTPNSDHGSFSSRSNGNLSGRLLLLAAQIHQNGHPDLANELAMAVFEATASREAVVDQAVSILADQAYEIAAGEFFASGDWAAYHRTLTELVARFPRGWSSREAVAMLLPQLAKQAAGEPPAAPAGSAIPIAPKALEAIQQLTAKPAAGDTAADDAKLAQLSGVDVASMTPRMRAQILASLRGGGMSGFQSASPWLLTKPEPAESGNSALARITTLGIDVLPALAALVNDPYLTYLPNDKAHSGSSYVPSNEGDSERILRLYTSLNRPVTRGEIACNLLRSALPDASRELNEAPPETLRELALAFWRANQHTSRDELAAVFLREGSSYQAQAAATLLASSTDPKAHSAFEAHMLAADPAIAQFQNVSTYLSARKTAAKPFFEAYAKLVRSQSSGTTDDDDSNEFSYSIKQAGGPEKILKQLGRLVAGKSPHALAKEIAHGEPAEAEAAIRMLLDTMKDSTPERHLLTLLEGAVAADDPRIRCPFLQAIYATCQEEDPRVATLVPGTGRPLAADEIKLWQQLVADTRATPEGIGGKSTIGDLAATMLEYSINPRNFRITASAAPILRKTEPELFRERAAAHLSGKTLPPLPDASRVTPDRLRKIIATAGTKPAPEIHTYLDALTPDERAAWLTWIRKPGDIPAPQSVKDLCFLVIGRNTDNSSDDFPDVQGAGNLDIGFKLTATGLKAQIETLAPDIAKHSRTVIRLEPAKFGPGLHVHAQVVPLPQPTPDNKADDTNPTGNPYHPDARAILGDACQLLENQDAAAAVIKVNLRVPDERREPQSATWLITKGKAKPIDPEQQAALESALQTLAASNEPQHFWLIIQILTKSDADKIMAPETNE